MAIYSERELPFPRGQTFSDAGVVTMTDTFYQHLEGKIFNVKDTEHGTGVPIYLMVVKNDSGSAITVENRLMKFSLTSATDFGRRISGFNDVAGGLSVPLDDAYSITSIPDDDLFYVIIRGYCAIKTEASSAALEAGWAVTSDASGYIDGAAAAVGNAVVGTVTEDTTDEATEVKVFVDIDLALPYGSVV